MFNNGTLQRTAAVALMTLGAVGCENARYTEAFYPDGDVQRVVIRSDAGSVELLSGSRLRVERTIRAPEGALDLSHQILTTDAGEEVLVLEAACRPILPCAVDMSITLPPDVPVEVSLDQGEIWASGIAELSVDLRRGSLDADITGPLQARIGTGDVEADLPAGADATVAVGRGDISLGIPAGAWQLAVDAYERVIDSAISVSGVDSAGSIELVAPSGMVRVSPRSTVAAAE